MRRQLLPALGMVLAFTVLTGLVYPLLVTGIGRVAFTSQADGSLVHDRQGRVVGSSLIGQRFAGAAYFHPRPSAAGDRGYDALASSGSNLGPTNPELLGEVRRRAAAYRRQNGLAPSTPVPVDAVTASGSGLDPDISVANARVQAPRVARARGVPVATVRRLLDEHTSPRGLRFLGEAGVDVFELNLALDRVAPVP